MYTTGMVFGSFDGLHEGHRVFLERARKYANKIQVALASDQTMKILKGVEPAFPYTERRLTLELSGLIDSVCPSEVRNDYACIREQRPSCIILGYDQQELHAHLLTWFKEHKMNIPILVLDAYRPDLYKSSLLYDRS